MITQVDIRKLDDNMLNITTAEMKLDLKIGDVCMIKFDDRLFIQLLLNIEVINDDSVNLYWIGDNTYGFFEEEYRTDDTFISQTYFQSLVKI